MRKPARLGALLVLFAVVGCGQSASQSGPTVSTAALPVLAASAVPGIPSVTIRLTAASLGKDAVIRGLAAKISSLGYLAGRQRTFQGESHHLTLVVSRALLFRNTTGARRYTAFVRQHQAAFFGVAAQAQQLSGPGASGWLFVPPLCACHLANPALIGVLSAGTRVIWLEINGPAATRALLMHLLGDISNVAVTRAS